MQPALFQIQKQGKENEYALDDVVAQAAGGNTLSMDTRSPYDHISSVESSPEYETEHLMTTIGAADPYTNALQHTALLRAQQRVNASVNAGGKSHQHTTPSLVPRYTGKGGSANSGQSVSSRDYLTSSSSASSADPTPSSVITTNYMALPSMGYNSQRKEYKKETRQARSILKAAAGAARAAGSDILKTEAHMNAESNDKPVHEVDLAIQKEHYLSDPAPSEGEIIAAHISEKAQHEEELRLLGERDRLRALVQEKEEAVLNKIAVLRQREARTNHSTLTDSSTPARTTADLVSKARLQKAAICVKWLQTLKLIASGVQAGPSVGLKKHSPSAEDILLTLRDGVILCRLVEKLERVGRLSGTVDAPVNSPAQRVQNVRRAMDYLKKGCSKLPVSAFMCENEIVEGKLETIVSLLMKLKKAYMYTT